MEIIEKHNLPGNIIFWVTSKVVVAFGKPELGGLIGDGVVPPVSKDATIAPPRSLRKKYSQLEIYS